jgi:hypothetical protein
MATARTGRPILARVLPALSLIAVAGACAMFGLSTTATDDPSGIAAGQAASLAAPAWITAVMALLAAVILLLGAGDNTAHRAGGLLGLIASVGAALGGLLNVVGYANSNIWWAANPAAIRQSAAILLLTAIVALVMVGSEQVRPGWRAPQPAGGAPPAG